jgi:hypothetical protein
MGTLSGNAIKNTYQGLLKTSDAAALTSSLKVIEDGTGVDSALSLSTTAVKAESLQINTVADGSSSTVLVWDSSSKTVSKRPLPIFDPITTTVTSALNPTVTIADRAGNSTSIQFSGGTGIEVAQAANTITFAAKNKRISTITGTTTLTADDSGRIYLLDANAINGDTITLPTCANGLYFKFLFITTKGTEFNIVTANAGTSGTVERFIGKVVVQSTTDDQIAVQRVTNTGNSYDNDTLSLDGDSATSGGMEGDVIEIYGCTISSVATWVIDARLTTTNANPSSIAVIGAS